MAPPLKGPSLCVYLGNLDSRVNERMLKELGIQVSIVYNFKNSKTAAARPAGGPESYMTGSVLTL